MRAGESETGAETSADGAGIRSVRGTRRAKRRWREKNPKEQWRQTGNTEVREQEEGDQSSSEEKTLMDRNESVGQVQASDICCD